VSSPLSIRARASASPGAIAASFESADVTWAEAEQRARAVAVGLACELGGAPVALVPRADGETLAVLHAALETGRALTLVHPRWTDRERGTAQTAAGSPTLLEPERVRAWMGARPTDAWPAATERADEIVVFTSGSTGAPRGARVGHAALAAAAEAHARALPFGPSDAWLGAMPLSHVGGLSLVTRCLAVGARVVLADRFEPSAFLELARRSRATVASVVPTMLERLLEQEGADALASLAYLLVGGASFPSRLRREARARGLVALATYGLTETSAQVATQRPGPPLRVEDDDSGPALPGVTVEIVDPEGRPVSTGEVGRIRVSGPTLFTGYVGAEARRERALDTADEGFLTERGELVVLGRRDDVIVTGGENVHPLEVESALGALSGVRAAAVFGVPDARWGQRVAAAIVLEPGAVGATVEADLAALGTLAPFKRPRLVAFVDALPVTPAGKLDRRACLAVVRDRLSPLG
jgi:O-succinylbenzoic acid--CoA ligase